MPEVSGQTVGIHSSFEIVPKLEHIKPMPWRASWQNPPMIDGAADSAALGCVVLAPHFDFQALRYSEEIF